MKTDVNKKLDDYYKKYKNGNINLLIKKFSNLNIENEYGGLSHAIVNYNYDLNWKLAALETLFKNGLNVNLQGKLTGYSFIHLSLYGYSDDNNNTKSYSTEFIVQLINLGKQYGLNVNIQDNDGDSIIHAALASEDYEGEVVPLIKALGTNFNLYIIDKDKRNITNALKYYIKQAHDCKNKKWEGRLLKEKENILSIFENQVPKSVNIGKVEKPTICEEKPKEKKKKNQSKTNIDINKIKAKIEKANSLKLIDDVLGEISENSEITSKLDGNILSNIKDKKEKLVDIINQIKNLIENNNIIYESLFFKQYLRQTCKKENDLSLDFINMDMEKLMATLEKLNQNSTYLQNEIDKKVESINTIKLIDVALENLSSDSKVTNQLDSKLVCNLKEQKEIFKNFISQIQKILDNNRAIYSTLFFQKYLNHRQYLSANYEDMNINELKVIVEDLNTDNENLKNEIKNQTRKMFAENYKILIELGLDKLLPWDEIIQIQNDAYQDIQTSLQTKLKGKIKRKK